MVRVAAANAMGQVPLEGIVEQLVRPPEQGVDVLRSVPLLERPVGQLGEVPRGRRAFE